MRTYKSFCLSAIFACLAFPVLLRAQFQNPTQDELKMTEDPRHPGVAAEYLNISQITDREIGYTRYYARIKVLAEKGKELATVEMPYTKHVDHVADIQARTIQPDGTIVPLSGKAADLLKTKTKDSESGARVFTLPSVQVGSILEYFFEIRYGSDYVPDPYWDLQHAYPVKKSHYMCDGCTNLARISVLPQGSEVRKDHFGHTVLDLEDVPPIPDEDWMPPIGEFLYRVIFYEVSLSEDAYWSLHGGDWGRSVNTFIEPSKGFRETVNGLASPSLSDVDKAKKLYAAVQSLDNTDFSREKSDAERKRLKLADVLSAEDVWTQKSGTATEMALLYLSMLRAAGVKAYAMRVADRSLRTFIPGYRDWDQLDDTIIIAAIDGKEIFLDPGEKMCPFQTMNWRHSMTTGVRQTATGIAMSSTPRQAYTANVVQRTGDVALDAHGGVDGSFRIIMTGQEALYWRQKALESDEAAVKKQFDQWVADMMPDGVDGHVDHFLSLDNPDLPLAAVVTAKGTAGAATSKRLLIPALFFATHDSHTFSAPETRQTPVDMHYGGVISDDVTYKLPAGYQVESVPPASKLPWEGHAMLIVNATSDAGSVTVTRTLARSFTLASTEDYPKLHDFYQKVAAADQQQIVLALTPAAKGN